MSSISLMTVATRSQAVARIADRTASQHLWGSHNVIDHVAISILYPICHFLLVVIWNQASISNCFRDIALQAYWGHEARVRHFKVT